MLIDENLTETIIMSTIAELKRRSSDAAPTKQKTVLVREHVAFVRRYYRRPTVRPLIARSGKVLPIRKRRGE